MSQDTPPHPPPTDPRVALLAQLYGLDLECAEALPEAFHPLTVQQRQAVLMLGEHTLAEVCEALGIHRVTMYRWRSSPDFRRAFLSLQRVGFDAVFTDAETVHRKNREFLETLRDNKDEPTKFRLAAVKLLETILADTLDAQLDERITKLERANTLRSDRLNHLRTMSSEELVEYTRLLVADEPDETDD